METYTPINSINKECPTSSSVVNEEVKILREANKDFKLEIIDLKQKLKQIYLVLADTTDNLIQQ